MRIITKNGGGIQIPDWLVLMTVWSAESIVKSVCAAKTGDKPAPGLSINVTKLNDKQ